MKTTKYRLLKDLPGCEKGTIFVRHANNALVAEAGAGGKSHVTISAEAVTVSPDWFEVVRDRPYPFDPGMGEDYFRADATEEDPFDRVMGESWDSVGMEIHWREISNLWRTEADARRRVDLEPLFNRALQAVINRGPAAAVSTEGSFGIGRDAPGGWRVTEHDPFIGYKVASGTLFSRREDAESVVAFLKALFA